MNDSNYTTYVLDLRKHQNNERFDPRINCEIIGKYNVFPFVETSDSSSNSEPDNSNVLQTSPSKYCRPYKTYPQHPYLSMTSGYSTDSSESFEEFRMKILMQIRKEKARRVPRRRLASNARYEYKNDQTYWEKRRKNNESAKRSRNAKRIREEEIAIRATFLEHENVKLKYEIICLRSEIEKLSKSEI